MKVITFAFGIMIITVAATCSVDEEVKSLGELKSKCSNLELELAGLKAKKWTKRIDEKVSVCREHGFWDDRKLRVPRKREKGLDW